ncbi:hypothetical protein CKAH01_11420 [Colletotrichum kahawae]|uniref:Tat pathway signal sequence n=1 Tax=Colletotrichum kahawae TaxID=34407 RepID=A0AAD9YXZ9_COLKA|nr:hypothetical protein CKAH01_11420 [Colletotrichum kahawae]
MSSYGHVNYKALAGVNFSHCVSVIFPNILYIFTLSASISLPQPLPCFHCCHTFLYLHELFDQIRSRLRSYIALRTVITYYIHHRKWTRLDLKARNSSFTKEKETSNAHGAAGGRKSHCLALGAFFSSFCQLSFSSSQSGGTLLTATVPSCCLHTVCSQRPDHSPKDDISDAETAPAIDAVEYEWVTYQNKFDQPSAYRGQPTPELEQAWSDLIALELINVPVEKLPALNKSTAGPWRHPTREQGGGVAGFIEVFHQLHCLNLVRQFTYRDSYNYSMEVPFGDTAAMLRLHVDHCIETIRLNLMCAGDVTPFLVTLDPQNKLGESPDFETLHRCRKFDKLAEWSKSHVASHELLKNEPGRKQE